MTHDEVARLAGQAEQLASVLSWGPAALAFSRVAVMAERIHEPEAGRRAWARAAESFRRDDRPTAALRAFHRALALGGSPDEVARLKLQLSGVLCELGKGVAAEQLCTEAGQGPLALDARISVLLGFGRKRSARPLVQLLAQAAGPAGEAGRFRQGQVYRMDGDLEAAAQCFALVAQRLSDSEAAVAAAQMELAEVGLLQGAAQEAIHLYSSALQGHERVGRRALAYRAEAGRQRALCASSVVGLTHGIDQGISWAEERGMVLLACDLRLARGEVRLAQDPERARDDLEAAGRAAEAMGARSRAGRASWLRARCPAPREARLALLDQAEELLEDVVPLLERVRLYRARMVHDKDGMARAVARFSAMGMEADAANARAALEGR